MKFIYLHLMVDKYCHIVITPVVLILPSLLFSVIYFTIDNRVHKSDHHSDGYTFNIGKHYIRSLDPFVCTNIF